MASLVDPTRCLQLITGVLGIYISYFVVGILQESMLTEQYVNNFTGEKDKFHWPAGFLIFPNGITWIIGQIVNYFQIRKEDKVHIPIKNSAICALTVSISTLTYTYAILLTNFPVVTMFKSCNILSVILVGVLCSRVADKHLKLGKKKIIVGILVTAGIVIFKVFDPQLASKQERKTEVAGIILLIVSLLADGFLPDFQAEIKSIHKPQPMEMMTTINKWTAIICFLYSCLLLETYDIFAYMFTHYQFCFNMVVTGVLCAVGQMFVYRMIKQFKQHFVPFVITTRKIFTVGISIVYYHHATNIYQIIGLIMVFGIVTYQFVSELVEEQSSARMEKFNRKIEEQNSQVGVEIEASTVRQFHQESLDQQIGNREKEQYEKRLGVQENPTTKGQNQNGINNE